VQTIKADITSITRGIIAHGCNCSGGFGSGVAGAIAWRFPEVKKAYHAHQATNTPRPDLLGTIQPVKITDELYVVNLFTQLEYGSDGRRYASVEAITEAIVELHLWREDSQLIHLPIHIPKIGSLRGGLDWETEVKPIFLWFEQQTPPDENGEFILCVVD